MMMMMSRIERTDIRVLFTFLFAVGSDVSILKAPLAAAIMSIYEPTEPSQPMMSDDANDKDRPQHRELRPLLFSSEFFNVPQRYMWTRFMRRDLRFIVLIREDLKV